MSLTQEETILIIEAILEDEDVIEKSWRDLEYRLDHDEQTAHCGQDTDE